MRSGSISGSLRDLDSLLMRCHPLRGSHEHADSARARISYPTVSTTSYSRWAISSDRVFAPYAPISTQWVTPDSSIRYS